MRGKIAKLIRKLVTLDADNQAVTPENRSAVIKKVTRTGKQRFKSIEGDVMRHRVASSIKFKIVTRAAINAVQKEAAEKQAREIATQGGIGQEPKTEVNIAYGGGAGEGGTHEQENA